MLVEKIEHFGRKNRTFLVEKSNFFGWEKNRFSDLKNCDFEIFFDLKKISISKKNLSRKFFGTNIFSNP